MKGPYSTASLIISVYIVTISTHYKLMLITLTIFSRYWLGTELFLDEISITNVYKPLVKLSCKFGITYSKHFIDN